jgi:hypothetical protein
MQCTNGRVASTTTTTTTTINTFRQVTLGSGEVKGRRRDGRMNRRRQRREKRRRQWGARRSRRGSGGLRDRKMRKVRLQRER